MNPIKYLNVLLTLVVACLILITLALTGLLPTASAKEVSPRYAVVPLNPDGSINVRLANGTRMDVNISQIRGEDIDSKVLPINIKEVDTRPVRNSPLPVVTK